MKIMGMPVIETDNVPELKPQTVVFGKTRSKSLFIRDLTREEIDHLIEAIQKDNPETAKMLLTIWLKCQEQE